MALATAPSIMIDPLDARIARVGALGEVLVAIGTGGDYADLQTADAALRGYVGTRFQLSIISPLTKGLKLEGQNRNNWRITNGAPGVGSRSIVAVTKANPAVCTTSAAHGLTTGQRIAITRWRGFAGGEPWVEGGMLQLPGTYVVTVTGANTFSLGVDSTAWFDFAGTAPFVLPVACAPGFAGVSSDGFILNPAYDSDNNVFVGLDSWMPRIDCVIDAGNATGGHGMLAQGGRVSVSQFGGIIRAPKCNFYISQSEIAALNSVSYASGWEGWRIQQASNGSLQGMVMADCGTDALAPSTAGTFVSRTSNIQMQYALALRQQNGHSFENHRSTTTLVDATVLDMIPAGSTGSAVHSINGADVRAAGLVVRNVRQGVSVNSVGTSGGATIDLTRADIETTERAVWVGGGHYTLAGARLIGGGTDSATASVSVSGGCFLDMTSCTTRNSISPGIPNIVDVVGIPAFNTPCKRGIAIADDETDTTTGVVTKAVSGGAITIRSSRPGLLVKTSNTATLTTINGGSPGATILIGTESGANTLTVAPGGNILLAGGANFVTTSAQSILQLVYIGATWREVSRAVGHA